MVSNGLAYVSRTQGTLLLLNEVVKFSEKSRRQPGGAAAAGVPRSAVNPPTRAAVTITLTVAAASARFLRIGHAPYLGSRYCAALSFVIWGDGTTVSFSTLAPPRISTVRSSASRPMTLGLFRPVTT